jgi:hypothetical protein
MPYTLLGRPQFKYGKHWYTTRQRLVCYSFKFVKRLCDYNVRVVREILPELVTQLMSLLSSEEAEQQEVGQYVYFLLSWLTIP